MAKVISVSVPDELYARWEESDLDISPSSLFQTALETQLGAKNQLLMYWSNRALDTEKKSVSYTHLTLPTTYSV